MLIALSGVLTGYNGTYPFEKPGDKYNGTSYEGMRIVNDISFFASNNFFHIEFILVLYYSGCTYSAHVIFYNLGFNRFLWGIRCWRSLFTFWYDGLHYQYKGVFLVIFILDVGMLTLNQYILLDPILLCFMTSSVWGMVKVSKHTHNGSAFSKTWWSWLVFTGAMLSCTISVKFVGLFVVILVGLHTINDLWHELGDLRKPVVS